MSTQGVGTFLINSKFASGSLVFYEKAVGRTTTGDVFTVGTTAVKVGNTAQDVDFQFYGTGSISAIIDCGAATFTLVGIATSTNGAVTITNATESTSTTTGALIVSGGIGFAKDMYVGDDVFLTSAAKLDWAAGNALLTHSTGLLTFSASNVAFGVDATGIDVSFFGDTTLYKVWFDQNGDTNGKWYFGDDDYGVDVVFSGQTASAAVTWDASADDLIWTGVARAILGTSGTPLVLTQGSPIVDIYTTCASTNGSNSVVPFYVKSVMTGNGGVGGRSQFDMYTTADLGGWANALKAYTEFGTSGTTTGLASAFCAEMKLPSENLGSGGAYYPLEVEYVAAGTSIVSAGSPTGNQVGFIYMANSGDADGDFDANGFFFRVNGLTAGSTKMFQTGGTTGTVAGSLKVVVNNTKYYLPLWSTEVQA